MTSVNSSATNTVVTEEVPARVKVTNYEPSTAGVSLSEVLDDDGSNMSTAIYKTQTEPVVVPSDVVDFLSHHKRSPKEDILRLAYGGTEAAQAEKLDMIFDDFEGLLKIAQTASGLPDVTGWTDNIIEKHNDLHTKLQNAKAAGSECPDWADDNVDTQRFILLQAKIVDLLKHDLTELFVNRDGDKLLKDDPVNDSDPRNVFAKKYELSTNAYFMFVMALAFAQLRYGYSVAGEVRCDSAVRDTSCKHRRCCQKPDVPLPIRIGILGVLPKIHEDTTLMSLFTSVLNTRCYVKSDDTDATDANAKLAKQAITQLDCVIPQMELVKRKLTSTPKTKAEERIKILRHIQDSLRKWKLDNDVEVAADDSATKVEDDAYNTVYDGTALKGHDVFTRVADLTDGNKDRQRLIHMINRAGLENLLNVNDTSISRVVQTSPPLPPHSDPINKIRGTRNLDLVEGYVLNRSSVQHGSTPYYYAGEVAVCKRQIPLVCLSRECPSWGMDNNNVVPFIEKPCGVVPDVPRVCKCIPRTRIEDTLANIRAEGPVFDISTMLFGIDMRWIHDQLVIDASVDESKLNKAFEKVVGNNYRKAFEKNSQVFVPGVAGAFYTNLMKSDDEDANDYDFSKRNAATVAREISEMVVAEMQPITLPIRSKMTLQQDIFDSCPNYMIPQLSKGNHMLPVVLKALKEKIDQTAYDYNHGSKPATNIVNATISRMFELSATPRAGSGLPKTTHHHHHKTLVEGASAAVELVETIRVTLPLTHSLNDAAKDLDADGAKALAETMSADIKAKVGKTHLHHIRHKC